MRGIEKRFIISSVFMFLSKTIKTVGLLVNNSTVKTIGKKAKYVPSS